MKIKITLKDPDGVSDSIDRAVESEVAAVEGIDEDERRELIETRREKIDKALEKWIEFSEYVRLEIDTDAGTCVVIPN